MCKKEKEIVSKNNRLVKAFFIPAVWESAEKVQDDSLKTSTPKRNQPKEEIKEKKK